MNVFLAATSLQQSENTGSISACPTCAFPHPVAQPTDILYGHWIVYLGLSSICLALWCGLTYCMLFKLITIIPAWPTLACLQLQYLHWPVLCVPFPYHAAQPTLTVSVLKSSPVRSFTPILRQPDQDRSFHFSYLRQPDQDHSRPVHVSPHSGCKPVATSLYQDRSKTSSQPIQNNIYED